MITTKGPNGPVILKVRVQRRGRLAVVAPDLSALRDWDAFVHPVNPTRVRTARGCFGVHINSTILSHAYFLVIEGGTNRTSGLSVSGGGRENRVEIAGVNARIDDVHVRIDDVHVRIDDVHVRIRRSRPAPSYAASDFHQG